MATIARLALHPEGLAPRVRDFAGFAAQLLDQMSRTHRITHDAGLEALLAEVRDYVPDVPRVVPEPIAVVPMRIEVAGDELTFVSTITTFGAARDITAQELSIETFYPADDRTRSVLAAQPWRVP